MTTVPDHSGKLISQVAHGDAGLKHEPTRKTRRTPARVKRARTPRTEPWSPSDHQQMENPE
jgi:hypothetical protein